MDVQQEISFEKNHEKLERSLRFLLIKKKPAATWAARSLTP